MAEELMHVETNVFNYIQTTRDSKMQASRPSKYMSLGFYEAEIGGRCPQASKLSQETTWSTPWSKYIYTKFYTFYNCVHKINEYILY
jgi:hypothetical protein